MERYRKELAKDKNAIVKVSGVVYPGVTVNIQEEKFSVNDKFEQVFFSLGQKEVMMQDMDNLPK